MMLLKDILLVAQLVKYTNYTKKKRFACEMQLFAYKENKTAKP